MKVDKAKDRLRGRQPKLSGVEHLPDLGDDAVLTDDDLHLRDAAGFDGRGDLRVRARSGSQTGVIERERLPVTAQSESGEELGAGGDGRGVRLRILGVGVVIRLDLVGVYQHQVQEFDGGVTDLAQFHDVSSGLQRSGRSGTHRCRTSRV